MYLKRQKVFFKYRTVWFYASVCLHVCACGCGYDVKVNVLVISMQLPCHAA